MRAETILTTIGFNAKDASIYLALLELGEGNIKAISQKAVIPRTSIYTPLSRLLKEGVVGAYKKGRRTYYIPASPEKLLRLQKERLKALEDNISVLRQKTNKDTGPPSIRFLEGQGGIRLILQEILNEQRPFLAITSIDDMNRIARDHFDNFIRQRAAKGLHVRLLTDRSSDAEKMKEEDAKMLRNTRFISAEYEFSTANYIFGNKVAILSLKRDPPAGIYIEDKTIADTHRMYFELLWENSR